MPVYLRNRASLAKLVSFDDYFKTQRCEERYIKKLNINAEWRVINLHIVQSTMDWPRLAAVTSGQMRPCRSQNEKSLLWIHSPDESFRECNHDIGSHAHNHTRLCIIKIYIYIYLSIIHAHARRHPADTNTRRYGQYGDTVSEPEISWIMYWQSDR